MLHYTARGPSVGRRRCRKQGERAYTPPTRQTTEGARSVSTHARNPPKSRLTFNSREFESGQKRGKEKKEKRKKRKEKARQCFPAPQATPAPAEADLQQPRPGGMTERLSSKQPSADDLAMHSCTAPHGSKRPGLLYLTVPNIQ